MEILAVGLDAVVNILYVALGLGLVIFFHELGHFAVAKWCDVHVERFSIGFGPILWRYQGRETEYALSAIPFGGYVKMLGQDDVDPGQLASEDVAQDPRSYSAKPVRQRMAIISAGVAMNVITGLLFFATAFGLGVEQPVPVLGSVQPGYPAWKAGLQPGDRVTRINDREIDSFNDLMRGIALSKGAIEMELVRGERSFQVTLQPNESGLRRKIGAAPIDSLKLIDPPDPTIGAVDPDTPAAKAEPPFQPGDEIQRVDGTEVRNAAHLKEILARKREQTVTFSVQRKGSTGGTETVEIPVEPQPFRTLGIWTDIGRITAIRQDSPAARSGFRVGDKIARVGDRDVGTDVHPLKLPDLLASRHGQEVVVTVIRQAEDGGKREVEITVVPNDVPGWTEPPMGEGGPLSVPALGLAYNLIPTVLKVTPGSPAEQAGIRANQRLREMRLTLPEGTEPELHPDNPLEIEFGKEEPNWAFAFWMMQRLPNRTVTLTVSDEGGESPRTLEISPRPAEDWFVPSVRGLRLATQRFVQKASDPLAAVQMGFVHTRNTIVDLYLTLRNLVTQRLSVENLRGPIGIAGFAYEVAQQGMAPLLLFLGFLSVNLAVLNFLPIPVLDGGHMVFLIWEAITRKRPSERVVVAATYIGMAVVLGLMVLVFYLDIFVHGFGG